MAVRRESVRIDVDSNLARVAARDAAAVKLLANTLDRISKTGVQSDRSNKRVTDSLAGVEKSARRADQSINNLTGRLRVVADVASILGPALAPVGAVAVPALVGLTTQLTFGAAAAGTALLAFNGMGDALGAMNDYAFEPTTANAEKLEASLARLSPEAVRFANELGTLRGQFAATRDAAAEGLFPELTPALDDLDGLLGRVQPVIREIGAATGEMLADGLGSLDSDRWQDFFDYLQSDARPILSDLGATVGGFAHGLSEVVTAFGPLNRDFSGWLRSLGEGFSSWAEGLDQTDGFQAFIDYVRQNGPLVADAAGAIGRALVEITTAAAPLGGPALQGITAFADAVAAIANSDIGTPIFTALAAMALFNRAMALGRASSAAFAQTRTNLASLGSTLDNLGPSSNRASAGFGRMARTAGGVAAVAGAVTVLGNALADATGATVDTANLSRDLEALANGGTPDLLNQLGDSLNYIGGWQNGGLVEGFREVTTGFGLFGGTPMDNALANIEAVDQTLAQLVESGNADQAAKAFNDIAAAALGLPGGSSVAPWAAEGVMANFGAYQTALDNAAAANDGYAASTDGAGNSAAGAAINVNELAQAMRTQASEALAAFDAQTQWGQAVADARREARRGKDGIDEMTQAGRDNRTALSGLAGAWNAQSREVKNNVGEYRQARRTFLEVADAMGIGKREARQLADELLEMPRRLLVDFEFRGMRRGIQDAIDLGARLGAIDAFTASPQVIANTRQAGIALGGVLGTLGVVDRRKANPLVTANTTSAAAALGGIINQIGNIHDKTVTITVLQNVQRGADLGGIIGGPKAYGGPVVGPGTDRSDTILTPTSPGEYVLQAPAVRKYGVAMIEQMNAMQMDRQALERQGVMSAMRSGGGSQRVNVTTRVSGFLTTSNGDRVSLEEIESLVDQKILNWADAEDDYARSMSRRVPA